MIAKRCCDSRPRPPRARRRAEPTARRRRSTRGALRFGDSLPWEKRAELLELRSRACYVTDEHDAARVAIEEAIEGRRKLGQPVDEARALRWLSKILFCPGLDAWAFSYLLRAVLHLIPGLLHHGRGFGPDIQLMGFQADAGQGLGQRGASPLELQLQLLFVEFGDDLTFADELTEVNR